MGRIQCDRHGEQLVAFTTGAIKDAASARDGHLRRRDIQTVTLEIAEVRGSYLVDTFFVNQPGLRKGVKIEGTLAEKIFGELVPICERCLAEGTAV